MAAIIIFTFALVFLIHFQVFPPSLFDSAGWESDFEDEQPEYENWLAEQEKQLLALGKDDE